MRFNWKKILIIIGALLLVAAGAGLYLEQRWNRQLRAQLQDYVKEMSDSLYTLRYTGLELNVFTGSLALEKASVVIDTAVYRRLQETHKAPAFVYTLSADRVELRYFKVWRYFMKKELSAGGLELQQPSIVLEQNARNIDTSRRRNAYENISRRIKSLSIGTLLLDNTNLKYTYIKKDSGLVVTQLHNLRIHVNNLLIDSAALEDPTRFLYARNYEFDLRDYRHRTPDSLYWLGVRRVHYNAAERTLRIGQFFVEPRYNIQAFDKAAGTQRDRYDVQLNDIVVRELHPQRLLEDQQCWAQRVDIGSGLLEIYHNRNLPMGGPKLGNYPHQLLQKVQLPIFIDSLIGKKVDLRYTEVSNKSQQAGTIMFKQVGALFRNITNIDSMVAKNPHCTADMDAVLMQSGMLQARFDFFLNDKNGGFAVSGQLKNMDGRQFTPVARALGMVEIKSCRIKDLRFNIRGNERNASGSVTLIYDNLKIRILKKDEETKQIKRKGLLSFFANVLVINDSNPPSGSSVAHTAHPRQARDPRKSFFNLIWKTLLEGVKETVMTANGGPGRGKIL